MSPRPDYRENLKFILDRIRAAVSVRHVIWGQITPVVDELHNLPHRKLWRCQSDVDHYNQIADEVMTAEGVPINDIAAPIHEMGVRNGLLIDGVHVNPTSAALLGQRVADRIDEAFQGPASNSSQATDVRPSDKDGSANGSSGVATSSRTGGSLRPAIRAS